MSRLTKRNALILLSIGMLIITSVQVLSHYLQLSDIVKVAITSVGIGVLIVAVFIKKPNTAGFK